MSLTVLQYRTTLGPKLAAAEASLGITRRSYTSHTHRKVWYE